jgi:hypothetical protein
VRQNIRKFSGVSEKSAASAKDLKNPRGRIELVNDLLQIGYFPALLNSSISAPSFDLNNYNVIVVCVVTSIMLDSDRDTSSANVAE